MENLQRYHQKSKIKKSLIQSKKFETLDKKESAETEVISEKDVVEAVSIHFNFILISRRVFDELKCFTPCCIKLNIILCNTSLFDTPGYQTQLFHYQDLDHLEALFSYY